MTDTLAAPNPTIETELISSPSPVLSPLPLSLQVIEVEPAVDLISVSSNPLLEQITNALVKNVALSTRRIYRIDSRHFTSWLAKQGLVILAVSFEDISEYRAYLADNCQNKATASRRLVIARRMLEVAVILKLRTDNPAQYVSGFKGGDQETTHTALTRGQARALLDSIDQSLNKGKRDYALILLLLRTGLRRAEAAGLTIGDLSQEQGHNIALIRHGKGDKRRRVKIPVDVRRAISDYLEALGLRETPLGAAVNAPLFVRFKKGDKSKTLGLDGLDIERIVEGYAKRLGIDLSPHGLRASFVTLALEGGAKLEQVQYAAGHADPRTTERYQKRKLNLDDNAVDYVRF